MAWPMCSWPVMLGGGITMVKGFLLRVHHGLEGAGVLPHIIDAALHLVGLEHLFHVEFLLFFHFSVRSS